MIVLFVLFLFLFIYELGCSLLELEHISLHYPQRKYQISLQSEGVDVTSCNISILSPSISSIFTSDIIPFFFFFCKWLNLGGVK